MNTLQSILRELISARVEQLAHEAEQHPDCVKAKEQMLPLHTKAEQLMGEDDEEELVSMACGCDIPSTNIATLPDSWTECTSRRRWSS